MEGVTINMVQTDNLTIKLICFPFAGAGASFFSGWNDLFINNSIEVLPIQLPGRERLIAEEPYRNIHVAASDFAKMIVEKCGDAPIALFGHCFLGATLAFEVARRLEKYNDVNLTHLFVSAASSPKSTRNYSLSQCDDERFVEEVEKLTGYKHQAFNIPELRELLIPTLRADFEMDETYLPESECCIGVPITAVFPDNDSFVSKDDVELWKECTCSDFDINKVTGEHMYISKNPDQCIEVIKNTLKKLY